MGRGRLVAILLGLLCLLLLPACRKLKDQGFVMLVDQSYSASVAGTNKSGFTSPDGLLWHQGSLYFADEGGHAVRIQDRTGTMRTLGDARNGFASPEDMVMDGEGNIFWTDDDAGGLWTADPSGATRLVAGKEKGLISTEGIALGPNGTILVGDGERHEVFSVTRTGDVSVFLGPEVGIGKPESMVWDPFGDLYIADNKDNILYMLDRDRHLHRIVAQRAGFSPETIFPTADTLWITDSKAGKVYKMTPREGLSTIAAFGGPLKNVQGITVDDRGDIYISVQSDLKRGVGYVIKLAKS